MTMRAITADIVRCAGLLSRSSKIRPISRASDFTHGALLHGEDFNIWSAYE